MRFSDSALNFVANVVVENKGTGHNYSAKDILRGPSIIHFRIV